MGKGSSMGRSSVVSELGMTELGIPTPQTLTDDTPSQGNESLIGHFRLPIGLRVASVTKK